MTSNFLRCALCGEQAFSVKYPGVHDFEYGTYQPVTYGICAECGVIAQHPLPSRAVVSSFYPLTYRNYQTASAGFFSFLKRIQENGFVRRITGAIGDNRDIRILEIGCGNGALLQGLRLGGYRNLSGADISGREPGGGIRFTRGNIEDVFPYDEIFDVIIMINVLEHFLDPLSVLQKCHEHVAPGGKLIIVTPNANSAARYVFGRYWAGFHAPRHMELFCEKTLAFAANKTGFQMASYGTDMEPGQWSLSIQNMLQDRVWGKTKLQNGLAWYTPLLSILCIPITFLQNFTERGASICCVLLKD